jgi:uncharacterized protein
MPEKKEIRNLTLSELRVKPAEGDTPPQITGYAAVFDSPSEVLFGFFREIIKPGAFKSSISGGDVRALWQHDTSMVMGRTKAGTLSLEEDSRGLKINITPPDTQWAKDAVETMKRGDVDQMSFGFSTLNDNWTKDDQGFQLRELLEVELFEVSPVTFPAYPDTTVAVRSMENKTEALQHPEPWQKAYRERANYIGGAIL